jgi:hypothetical protein
MSERCSWGSRHLEKVLCSTSFQVSKCIICALKPARHDMVTLHSFLLCAAYFHSCLCGASSW